MSVRQEHRTFQSLFSDPNTCPFGTGDDLKQGIAYAYEPWDTTTTTTSTSDLMEDIITTLSETTGGIAAFQHTEDCPSGTLRIIHGVAKYPGHPGREDAHKRKVFGYLDDVDDLDITTVQLSNSDFDKTDELNVANTGERHLELLNHTADRVVVPPIADNAPNSKSISSRGAMFIPHPLVPYVIGKRLNAKQAFVVLFPVIQHMGLEQVCSPLVDFLMAAGTQHDADEETHPVLDVIGIPLYDAPAVIKYRRANVLYKQLPDLKSESTSNNNNNSKELRDIVSSMQGVHSVTIRDLEEKRLQREEKSAPTTVPAAFGTPSSDMLCKATGVSHHEDLPLFWSDLAGRQSKEKPMTIIMRHFQINAEHFHVSAPFPTGNTVQAFQNLMFVGSSEENTGSGVLPLSFAARNSISTRGRARLAADEQNFHNVLAMQQGNGQISAADARSIQNTTGYFTVDWTEAEQQIESYLAPLATMLGRDHANVKEHQEAYAVYRINRTYFQQALNRIHGLAAPAVFVFIFHVHHRSWFEMQMTTIATTLLPPPPLAANFRQFGIGRNLSWLPEISHVPILNTLANLAPVRPPNGGGGILGGGGAIPGGGDDIPGRGRDNENDANLRPQRRQRTRSHNLNRSPLFTSTNALNTRIVRQPITPAIATAGSTPQKGGSPRCLSWHLKGTCFDDCGRVQDHVILSDAEATELYGWCRLAFP